MTFESYITYEEYISLGGAVSEDAFPLIERKAQRTLDYFTFNRIPLLETVPDEVKEVLTEFINKMYAVDINNICASNITTYSNGVESITYNSDFEQSFNKELYDIAVKWLPNYLTARSVAFDVRKYLQSKNNNP